ncbi:phage tail protein [Paludibaculum fermentans]|uniref:Tip attachment protein J domain-containing protein n=1 Tax=Paludibaculum fermentans TaxID=1473598 RepID=A0A7S7SL89_PALFE|nr:hypothetical protein [Paludibaculum fermentans]QOY88176.1 hypothetical protein IRI77_36485 [Paludibaculum fermentans]
MSDFIGSIAVPEIAPSGVFPIVSDLPHGRAQRRQVVVHQFGTGNAKIEQRFLLGAGARSFIVRRAWLRDSDRLALRNFWESKYGPYGAFTYNAPHDDGTGTTACTCRFANEPLSWEMVADWACTVGVTLVEIPASNPTYPLSSTVTRFPPQALQDALLSQVQQVIPLIRIQPLQSGYPAIYVSDRRCTIGSQLYLPRLVDFDGISQAMGNEADDAAFTFGNADRVMRDLANDVDLFRASIEFSLYHVGAGIKLDLWRGDIVNWSLDAGPEFKVTAADGLYELNLPYPTRKISRTCWKPFNSQACPYASAGALDLVHFPTSDAAKCDKGYETDNGCLAHGMKRYYGGLIAEPQGVRIKDNSTGVWGFGRSSLTSVSLIADSIYDQVVPEIYTDGEMPVNCKVAAGRDESDFYEAMGIVGEGPLGAFTPAHYEDLDNDGTAETFVGSTLDGQAHHGYPTNNYGLRQCLGADPAGATDFFSLDQSGNTTGGDWRKVFSGNSTYKDSFAAGTAFVVIRRSDAKGLQLSKPGDHAMIANVQSGMSGWVWTSLGVRVYGPPLTNPVWIAINMLFRARGLRLGAGATTQQLDLAESLFDVQAAIDAAAICDKSVTALVGPGSETQFKFRGVLQEEKPLRDWLQEALMNGLGYYTFAFGKLKLGIRENSSAAEAFTVGNILFNSLQLAPLKPSFNHLTANFADQDYQFVNNSVTVYDIDYASQIGGAAGPLFLKSNVNLSGTASKSQAARIISVRLREELGGTSPAEWKAARQLSFRTTVLALNTEPGTVCSMTHPDMPGSSGEFRVTSWRLNKDYSIDIQGRTTTDSMYDLVAGPKPADVVASPVPQEVLIDTGVPGLVTATPMLSDYGSFALENIEVQPDASGNANIVSAEEVALSLYYVDELTTDLWAMFDGDVNAATDPLTVDCTVNQNTARAFRVGDFVIINDEATDPDHSGRRSYECAQIVGPGDVGDVVPTGEFQFQRAYPGVPDGQATFGTLRCAHQAGVKFYKLDLKTFTYSVKKGFFRTPGLPARIEAKLPSACIVAAVVSVANHFGYGPFTVIPLSHHNEPLMPGERTCSGGAYTFQMPSALAAQDDVPIPMRVHDPASIRCIFAYLQTGTSDGSCGLRVKYSADGGDTWLTLEKMGIAQNVGTPFKTTYDHLLAGGFGPPESRRLPYRDYGLINTQDIVASPDAQVISTASYDGTTTGLVEFDFVFFDFGGPNEEYVYIQSLDPPNQTFTAVVRKDHPAGTKLSPAVWPTPVLREGYNLSFDIRPVASPNPGSDLTVVIQT